MNVALPPELAARLLNEARKELLYIQNRLREVDRLYEELRGNYKDREQMMMDASGNSS